MINAILSFNFKEYKIQRELYQKLINSKWNIETSLKINKLKGLSWLKEMTK